MSFENAYRPYQPQQESSGKATAALVLGICGFVVFPFVPSVLAIVFGNQARDEIARSGGRLGGSGQAQAGVILGWVGIALDVLMLVLVLLMFSWVFSAGGDTTFSSSWD